MTQTPTAMVNEIAKRNIENCEAAWKDLSQYVTIPEGEETTLRFFPLDEDGIQVKQDTYKGNPSGWKTFYKVVDVNSTMISSSNAGKRTFKANRKSSMLINKELLAGNYVLRIKHVGSGMDTVYQPVSSRPAQQE